MSKSFSHQYEGVQRTDALSSTYLIQMAQLYYSGQAFFQFLFQIIALNWPKQLYERVVEKRDCFVGFTKTNPFFLHFLFPFLCCLPKHSLKKSQTFIVQNRKKEKKVDVPVLKMVCTESPNPQKIDKSVEIYNFFISMECGL